jgi:hypothetical protein
MAIFNILRQFGIIYGHLVMLWIFGTFSPVLVYCVEKNLATLVHTTRTCCPDSYFLKFFFSYRRLRIEKFGGHCGREQRMLSRVIAKKSRNRICAINFVITLVIF